MSEPMGQKTLDLAYKNMVNGNVFRQMLDSTTSAVLVVGPQGAGKSTNIGIQLGARYEARISQIGSRKKRVYECVQSDAYTPQTSDGFTSKTLNIGVYKASDEFGGTSYFDTAGMNEDRTEAHRIWTRWSLSLLFAIVPKIKCVVVVIDFRTMVAERGHGMRDLAKSLAKIVGSSASSQHFYESMIFLVTHGYEEGFPVEPESVLKIAEEQHTEQEQQLKERLKPQSRRFQMPGMAQQYDALPPDEHDQIDIEDRVGIVTLLKTIMNAEGKVYMCFPETPEACDRQRMIVQNMIEQVRPINKQGLQDIASARQNSNLEVLQVLSQMTIDPSAKLGGRSYAEILRLRGDNLDQLLGHLKEHENRLHAIESNWRGVQRDKEDELEHIKADHTRRIAADAEQIRKLEVSPKPTVIATREIKKAYPAYGWWGLAGGGWAWGTTSAEEILRYNDAWFSDYKIRGGDYAHIVDSKDPLSGNLVIAFTSTPRTNLNLEVDFIRPERDTEETKRVVASLHTRIAEMQVQVNEVGNQLVNIRNTGSAQALVELLLAEKSRFEKVEMDFLEQLDSKAVLPTEDFPRPPSEMSVQTNLAKLLSVLKDTGKLHAGLASGTKDPIEEFLKQYDRVKKLESDLHSGPGQKFISLQRQGELVLEVQTEDSPPVRPTAKARIRLVLASEAPSWIARCAQIDLLDHLASNRASLATSMLTYGSLLKWKPAPDMQGALGNILIAIAIYALSVVLFSDGVHTVASQVNSMGRAFENMRQWIRDLLQDFTIETRGALEQMTEHVTSTVERLKVQLLGGVGSAEFDV